jgi:transposase
MTCVGVDVAKTTHYACVMNGKHMLLTKPFAFSNDEAGFAKFRASFQKHPKDKVIVGLESTSFYGENLIAFLAELGCKIALINPIEISNARKKQIRNAKTDKKDATLICKYLASEEYRLLQPKELQMLALRSLCRFWQTMKKSKNRLKTQLVSYLDLCFPEYTAAFSNVHGKGAYAALLEYPSAQAMAKANVIKLSDVLRKASRGRPGRERAELIKSLAKRSIAAKTCDMGVQIRAVIPQIQLIEAQLKDVQQRIETTFSELDSVLRTIPGVGAINGAMILSEIGDIKRFSNPGQLIAFAGLDPITRQSGKFRAKTTRMSKRGSITLRYTLMNAAWNVSLNNKTFGDYFDEKMRQKNRHYAALGHVAGKLTRVIFAMLKNEMAFNLP